MIDRESLHRLFEKLDDGLPGQQTLCVIGAAAVLGAGHSARQTGNIDIWRPASSMNDRDLPKARLQAGLLYNPTSINVDDDYLKIVVPGVVQLPDFKEGKWATGAESETLWQGKNLQIVTPPAAIVIAAKLVRGEDRDIDDCAFMIEAKRVSIDDIRSAVAKIRDKTAREAADENLVLLEIMGEGELTGPNRGRDRGDNER